MKRLLILFTLGALIFSCEKEFTEKPTPEIISFFPTKGGVGTKVKIYGKNFPDKFAVSFNGVKGSVDSVYSDTALVTVPGSASTGKISISESSKVINSTSDFTVLPGTWLKVLDFESQYGIYRGSAFTVGAKGYILNSFRKTFYQFDPTSNTVVSKADFPGKEAEGCSGFVIGNTIYVTNGGTNGEEDFLRKEVWAYNTENNTWSQKKDFPGESRWFAASFAIGGKGYISLGFGRGGEVDEVRKDMWEYNPVLDEWTLKGSVPNQMTSYGVSLVIGEKAYIGLGFDVNFAPSFDFWEYNPTLDTWIQKANFPGKPKSMPAAFTIGSAGYIGAAAYDDSFWKYDPISDGWSEVANFTGDGKSGYIHSELKNNEWKSTRINFGEGRSGAYGFAIGNKGYFGGGYTLLAADSPTGSKDIWEFNP